MQTRPLLAYFSNYWPLDKKAAQALDDRIIVNAIRKRECILKAGEECNHFTFVTNGCLKMYKIDSNGDRHNLQFAIENNWITDYGSFYEDKPSELHIEALEQSDLLQIRKDDLFYLYDRFPVFDRNFRIIIENAFIEQQERVLQNISSTAEGRYLSFLKRYPKLIQRVSNVQIASYIGVTPEFLSMVRRKLASK